MHFSRRDCLVTGAAGLLLPMLGQISFGQQEETAGVTGSEGVTAGFRFVHMTDLHIQPEKQASEGVIKALHAVQALNPAPDFILTGGDLIFDCFQTEKTRAVKLFDLYKQTLANDCSLPVHNCIGNHDVFGWGKPDLRSGDPQYGKKLVKDMLEMEQTYHAFDHKGVRFYVLDTIETREDNKYRGKIHGEQLEWLKADLSAKPKGMPAIVVTHIPIFTMTVFGEATYQDGAFVMPNNLVCEDTLALTQLFEENNVMLALSGHIHLRDNINIRGVSYINGGAVCGSWWNGPHRGIEEGFGVIDVTPGRGFGYEYVDYGWVPAV